MFDFILELSLQPVVPYFYYQMLTARIEEAPNHSIVFYLMSFRGSETTPRVIPSGSTSVSIE